MEQGILTSFQKAVIEHVAKERKLKLFYLTGGTALSVFYLKHRFSDDLDFFIEDEPDDAFLREFVFSCKNKIYASAVRFERLYDRREFFFTIGKNELKVEFTRYPFPSLRKRERKLGISIDSLRDIAANKFMAMIDRFDPKDFVDLRFILEKRNLSSVRRDAEKKFGITISPFLLGGEMAKVRRIEALPRMIKPLDIRELKHFFTLQARTLGKEIL